MLKTLLYYEKYEVFFYYGVFSTVDFDFVASLIKFFDSIISSTYPSKYNFQLFSKMMKIYDNRQIDDIIPCLKETTMDRNIQYYEDILESYNFKIKDQIINLMKNSKEKDSDIFCLKKSFNQIEINEKEIFKKKSKLLIFLITKNYLESEIFETHLNEAVSLNKEIFILLLEGGLDVKHVKFGKHKVYNICDAVDKCRYYFPKGIREINTKDGKFYELITEIKKILEIDRRYKKFKKRQLYLLYSENNEFEVMNFINQIDDLNNMIKCKLDAENEAKLIYELEKSNLVVLFHTTNDSFLNSEKYKKELDYITQENKLTIHVLIDNQVVTSIDLKHMQTGTNDSEYKKIQLFIFRLLQINKNIYYKGIHNWIDISLINIKKIKKQFLFNDIEFISKDEILANNNNKKSSRKRLRVINIKTRVVLGEINYKSNEINYCWIDHLNQLMILNDDKSQNLKAKFYNKFGVLEKQVVFSSKGDKEILLIRYEKSNRKTFIIVNEEDETENTIQIFDENFKNISNKPIDIIPIIAVHTNKYVFISGYPSKIESDGKILKIQDTLFIYDLSYNFVTSVEMNSSINHIFFDFTQSNYIYIETTLGIEIFDYNNFTLVGSIEVPAYFLKMIYNEKMIFSDLKESLFLYKINFNKNSIDKRYSCKMMNKFNPHLFSNPYILPCRNSICLDCFYNGFNFYCGKFCCNFESCKEEHNLSNDELKEDLALKKVMLEDSQNIIRKFIEFRNSFSGDRKDEMINELIDNKFDYLEDVMETRFQSLHIDLDILKENFFQEIDILEQKLILNNRFMRGTFEICKIKDDISYQNVGTFYNEFCKEYFNYEFYDKEARQLITETDEDLAISIFIELFK